MRFLRLILDRLVERVDVDELVDLLLEYLLELIGLEDLIDRLSDDEFMEALEDKKK